MSKREWCTLREWEASLRRQLGEVQHKRMKLETRLYGTFCLFSRLPTELLFLILDTVLAADMARPGPCASVFAFFNTCSAARSLRDEWVRHAYRQLGGLLPDPLPVPVMYRLLVGGNPRCPLQLLQHGMHAPTAFSSGYTIQHHPLHVGALRLKREVGNRDKAAALATLILDMPGFDAIDAVNRNRLAGAVTPRQWQARLAREPFETVVLLFALWGVWNAATVRTVVNSPERWKRALLVGPCNKALGPLLQAAQPHWFASWQDVWVSSAPKRLLCTMFIETFFEHAPDFLLTLPDVPGGGPTSGPWYHDIAQVMMLDSWERVTLSGTYDVKFDSSVDAVEVCRRITARGGQVDPKVFFRGEAQPAATQYVDWSKVPPPNPRQIIQLRKLSGSRTQLVKDLRARAPWGRAVWEPLWRDLQRVTGYLGMRRALADLFEPS